MLRRQGVPGAADRARAHFARSVELSAGFEASPYVVQYYATHIGRARQGIEKLLALVSDGWRRG